MILRRAVWVWSWYVLTVDIFQCKRLRRQSLMSCAKVWATNWATCWEKDLVISASLTMQDDTIFFPKFLAVSIKSVHTRCIPSEQAPQRKSKTPRKSPEKWTFLSPVFYNAPSLHIVDSTPFLVPGMLKNFNLCCGCRGNFATCAQL